MIGVDVRSEKLIIKPVLDTNKKVVHDFVMTNRNRNRVIRSTQNNNEHLRIWPADIDHHAAKNDKRGIALLMGLTHAKPLGHFLAHMQITKMRITIRTALLAQFLVQQHHGDASLLRLLMPPVIVNLKDCTGPLDSEYTRSDS